MTGMRRSLKAMLAAGIVGLLMAGASWHQWLGPKTAAHSGGAMEAAAGQLQKTEDRRLTQTPNTTYLVTGRNCNENDQPVTQSQCETLAQEMGLSYKFQTMKILHLNYFHAPGCSLSAYARVLSYNTAPAKYTHQTCDKGDLCICRGDRPFPTALHSLTQGTCSLVAAIDAGDCRRRATELGISIQKFRIVDKDTLPAGCVSRTARGKLLFNTNMQSKIECSEDATCICMGTGYPDLDAAPPEEANPENPPTPAPVPGYFSSDCLPCQHPIDDPQECRQKAGEMGKYYNHMDQHKDENFPTGCFKILNRLWFNHYSEATDGRRNIRRRRSARQSDGSTTPMCDGLDYEGLYPNQQKLTGKMECICKGTAPVVNPIKQQTGKCLTPIKSCECRALAERLGLPFSQFNASMVSSAHPPRCIMDSTNILWWNSALDSQVECGNNGTMCICA